MGDPPVFVAVPWHPASLEAPPTRMRAERGNWHDPRRPLVVPHRTLGGTTGTGCWPSQKIQSHRWSGRCGRGSSWRKWGAAWQKFPRHHSMPRSPIPPGSYAAGLEWGHCHLQGYTMYIMNTIQARAYMKLWSKFFLKEDTVKVMWHTAEAISISLGRISL